MIKCCNIDLSSLACPLISVNHSTQSFQNHSKGKSNLKQHCTKESAIFYFTWLTNERGIDDSGSTLVTEFNIFRLDYGVRESESFNFKGQKHKIGNQFLQRKLLLAERENCFFANLVFFLLNLLFSGESRMSTTQRIVRPPRPLLMSKNPVFEEIDKNDPSLPEEIEHVVKDDRVHEIVHCDKTESLSACFMVPMRDFLA